MEERGEEGRDGGEKRGGMEGRDEGEREGRTVYLLPLS